MQEESQDKLYDYLYSKYMMKTLFGISMSDDDFVEDSYFIFRGLGNVATATHAYNATVDSLGQVDLPCNCEFISSVSLGNYVDPMDDSLTVVYGTPTTVTIS